MNWRKSGNLGEIYGSGYELEKKREYRRNGWNWALHRGRNRNKAIVTLRTIILVIADNTFRA